MSVLKEIDDHSSFGASNFTSVETNAADVMTTALERMGATGVITAAASDTVFTVEGQFRKIVTTLVTNRSKEPAQLYHWMPEADYHPDSKGQGRGVVRVTAGGERMVGVPYKYYFPKEQGASSLMIQSADGDMPLLQFLRNLPGNVGHSLTFFRGELRQPDFTYMPSKLAERPAPAFLVTRGTKRTKDINSLNPVGSARARKRKEPRVSQTIQRFFMLPVADREDILSRMAPNLRKAIDDGFIVDEHGVHRRPSTDLGEDPGTWHGRMMKADQFIYERISVGAGGVVSRKLSNLENARRAFKIGPPSAGSEMSMSYPDIQTWSGKKNKKKKR